MEIKKYKSVYCQISYLKKKDAILCEWLQKCSGDDYKEPLKYGLELLQKTNAITWITDTTNGFENEEEDSAWLLKEFIPQTIESSCEKIIFIIDSGSPLKNEIDEQSRVLSEYFKVVQVEDLEKV